MVGRARRWDESVGGEKNDGARLRRLVGAHIRSVEDLLLTLQHDPAVRDELLADVIILVHQRRSELEPLEPQKVRIWMLRAARYLSANAARRELTRRRRDDRLAREPIIPVDSAEVEYIEAQPANEDVERFRRVRAAWDALDPSQRDLLTLDVLGQKGPAIAVRLGISHQAARSRLMRARAAFVTAYEALGDPEVAER